MRRLPALLVVLAAGMGPSGCGSLGTESFVSDFLSSLDLGDRTLTGDRMCGPSEFAPYVPDCPLGLVCFTSACDSHNECYSVCGVSKAACDQEFLESMLTVCMIRFALDAADLEQCHSLAFTYWLAVSLLGDDSFDNSQEIVCFQQVPGRPPLAACCLPDGGCHQVTDKPGCVGEGGAFIPATLCSEFECIPPANDVCADAEMACSEADPDADIGRCAGTPDEVCSISAPSCSDGSECVPESPDSYRCRVPSDNRMADTDGPETGGICVESGETSFQADVWFRYEAPCSGRLIVRMCDSPGYDAMLAVHGSNNPAEGCVCPEDNGMLLQCDDDFCGRGSVSAVTIDEVVQGACFTIRVGGWAGAGEAMDAGQGLSELDIVLRCRETTEQHDNAAPATTTTLITTPQPPSPGGAAIRRDPY